MYTYSLQIKWGLKKILRIGVAMEMLLHNNGNLQDSTVAFVIDARNMWEVSMEGSHSLLAVQEPGYSSRYSGSPWAGLSRDRSSIPDMV
jgi:hypothetical protein